MLSNVELDELLNELKNKTDTTFSEDKLLDVLKNLIITVTNHGECFLVFKKLPIICHFVGYLFSIAHNFENEELRKLLISCLEKLYFIDGLSKLEMTSTNWVKDLVNQLLEHHFENWILLISENKSFNNLPKELGYNEESLLKMLHKEVSKDDDKCNKIKIMFLAQHLISGESGNQAVKIMTGFFLNSNEVLELNETFKSSLKLQLLN